MDRAWTTVLKIRRPIVVLIHLLLIAFSSYTALYLRFDGDIPQREWALWLQLIPWVLVIRGITFVPFRMYEGLWRYTSVHDLSNIIFGVTSSSALAYLFLILNFKATWYPRSVVILDTLLLIMLTGGIRIGRRLYREVSHLEREKRILILGAGDAGEMIVRDMKNSDYHQYEPVGFVDDDPLKVGQRIHGVKVLGTRSSLAKIIEKTQPHCLLVAIPKLDPAEARSVVKSLEPFKLPIQTLPNLRDLVDGQVNVSHIRNLAIEDLLERAPIVLNSEPVTRLIGGKCVLISGAGGSIGSELCRQVLSFRPSRVVLFERYENGLYEIASELEAMTQLPISAIIGDVTDAARVEYVMSHFHPEIVFHAAAHKHVPMMELNPCEAVKNNVLGTRNLAQAALQHGVQKFILISTDKAVNPTSVMGATKRVAELLIQTMNGGQRNTFVAVRFGNVLGSNGSVVPRFLSQIRSGGPVTVTDPEIKRYFMLIPEAVNLVLHAATATKGGQIFVLKMGEQMRLVDLARNLIRLSGLVPDKEIKIEFIGLRPGEKLYEELVADDEAVEQSSMEKIQIIQPRHLPDPATLVHEIMQLEFAAKRGDSEKTIGLLQQIVPTYRSSEHVAPTPEKTAMAPAVGKPAIQSRLT